MLSTMSGFGLLSSTRSKLLCAIVLLVICAGCTTSAQQSDSAITGSFSDRFAASDSQLPAWLKSAIGRENDRLNYTSNVTLGEHYQLTVAGTLAEKPVYEKDGNYWYLQSEIGSEQLLECIVYVDEQFAFDTLNATLLGMIEGFDVVEETAISGSAVMVDGGVPMAFVEYISRVKVDGELQIYMPKGMVATKRDRTLVCVLGDAGFRDTLEQSFRRMVESWRILDAGDEPDYREVQLIELRDQPVGYVQIQVYKRADSGVNVFSDNGMLLPNGPSQMLVSESFLAEYAKVGGELDSARSVAVSNGAQQRALWLNSSAPGEYTVTGTLQGKEVSFSIDAAQNPVSSWGVNQVYRQLIGDATLQRAQIPVWSPDVDPSTVNDSIVRVVERARGENRIEYTLGPIVSNSVVDEQGSSLSGSIRMGSMTVGARRVFKTGELP